MVCMAISNSAKLMAPEEIRSEMYSSVVAVLRVFQKFSVRTESHHHRFVEETRLQTNTECNVELGCSDITSM